MLLEKPGSMDPRNRTIYDRSSGSIPTSGEDRRGEGAMDYRFLQESGALNEARVGSSTMARGNDRTVSWRGRRIPAEVPALMPESLARENLVFPIEAEGETVTVAAVDPADVALKDKLSFVIARKVR